MRPYSVAVSARKDRLRAPLRLVVTEEAKSPASSVELPATFRQSRGDELGASPTSGAARSVEEVSDASLVFAMKRGDPRAFEQLYRRHAPYALALAVRVQGNANEVEDIVHDAFVRVQEKLGSLQKEESFRSWFSAVVVSLVRTRLRKRKLRTLLGLAPADPVDLDALASREAGPEVRAQLRQVYEVLGTLSVDERIAWSLRYVEGRKLEEVAELAGCSLATVKRRVLAAQQRLLIESWRQQEEIDD